MLNLPIIIVARTTLGTINHTVLTVRQAQIESIQIAGIILNQVTSARDEAEDTNPAVIQKFSTVPVLGQMPHIQEEKRCDISFLSATARAHIDLSVFMH